MKKNDIASLVLIAAISGVISYFVANAVIGSPKNNPVEVEKMAPIQASFPKPDARVFNSEAIDPTVEINGQNPQSNTPFSND